MPTALQEFINVLKAIRADDELPPLR